MSRKRSSLDLIDELQAIVNALAAADIDYAVCGGLAMAIHGYPRATEDIDLLLRPEDARSVLDLVKGLGFGIPGRPMVFGLKTATPRRMQRISKLDPETNELLSLDLIDVNPELEQVWTQRIRFPWGGGEIRVVSQAGLVTMKTIAARPQDLVDIATLQGTTDDEQP
jgi:hypothetical protein